MGDRLAERHRRVAAEGDQAGHLHPQVPGTAGGRDRRRDVTDRGRVVGLHLQRAAAGKQRAGLVLRVAGPVRRFDALGQQFGGVGHGRAGQRLLPGQPPAAGRPGPVPRRGGVPGHRLGAAG